MFTSESGRASLSEGALVLAPLPVVAGLPVLHSGTAPQAGRLDKIRPVRLGSRILTPLVQSPATPPKSREHFCTPT